MVAKKSAAKRISRNKKRYWRKGVDITDVETFKSDVRKEERLGLTQKHDNDLFFIHKDPSDRSGNAKLQSKVTLRCFSNLLPDSAVEAFAEQNRGRKATKRREALQEKKLRSKKFVENKSAGCNEEKICDLWEEPSRKFDYLPPETEVAYLRSTKRILPKVPTCSRIATTALKPVASPHPGQSYNPSFEDHQDLLKRAVLEEAKKIEVVEKLNKHLTPKGDMATEATKFAEACEGLDLFTKANNLPESDDDENVVSDNEDIKPDLEKLKPLIAKIDGENRKTAKVRKREKIQKLEAEKRKDAKLKKQRENEVFRLKSLKKELNAKLKTTQEKMLRRQKLEQEKYLDARKIGKNKFVESDLDLNLSSEIRGSLRKLKVEGNLMEDRYKSILKRNIVEVRNPKRNTKRKYKLKKYQKPGADEITVDYVPR